MGLQRLEQIKAGYELTTPGKWVIHYPQLRSKPHIVSLDKHNCFEWIAEGVLKGKQARDDITFACNAHQDVPDLVQEIERLQDEVDALRDELIMLFGLDYRAGMRQFIEMMEGV